MAKIKRRMERRGDTKAMIFVSLLFFILFPYIISGFSEVEKETITLEEEPGTVWVMEQKIWGSRKVALEEYLIGMVAATIPIEYDTETLKAQAIILRSFCMTYMEKEEGKKIIYDKWLKEYYFSNKDCQNLWEDKMAAYIQKIQQAVSETKGMILVCDGDIIKPPFCRMSNGSTRDISEYIVHKEKYPYLKTVLCREDEMAKEFIQYVEITQKEFEENIKTYFGLKEKDLNKIVLYKDALNYVKEVEIGEKRVDGEEFRKSLSLVSSCYSLEKVNENIEIQTRGMGHGYGFSQYGANQMALAGKDYKFLLNYFFANITLEKI